ICVERDMITSQWKNFAHLPQTVSDCRWTRKWSQSGANQEPIRSQSGANRNSSRPTSGNRNLDGARGRNLAAQLKQSRLDGPEQRLNSVAYIDCRVVVRSKIIAESWRRAGNIH